MLFVVEGNSLCHKFHHMLAKVARDETGDMEALPDVADVLEWFLVRLDNLKEYVDRKPWGLDARFICVFDSTSQTFRKQLLPSYKAQRVRCVGVSDAVRSAREAVTLSSDWIGLTSPDLWEADDLIASICHQSKEDVIIHSGDKDFHQCLEHGRVGIIKDSRKGEMTVNEHGIMVAGEFQVTHYTCEDFDDQFKFSPRRWVDYQCMAGDVADNVKGCPGIGAKTAAKIIRAFPDVELEDLSVPRLVTQKYLNKAQEKAWPQFINDLEVLRVIFALRRTIPFCLETPEKEKVDETSH